jgi:hypothetical protein
MNRDKDHARGAGSAYRNVVNRLSSIRGTVATHTRSPRGDFDRVADRLEGDIQLMTRLAVESAKAQGKPFRNPFVRPGERLYRIRYRWVTSEYGVANSGSSLSKTATVANSESQQAATA